MDKQAVFDFIRQKEEKLCVLATVAKDNTPECAVVGYAAKEDGTIVINTNRNTRKVANLKGNNTIAIVIGWNFAERNVQYEGTATIIDRDHDECASLEEFFFTTNPKARKFESPDTIFIRIKPTWVKMIDLTGDPKTEEFVVT